jgi:hypothetical protein
MILYGFQVARFKNQLEDLEHVRADWPKRSILCQGGNEDWPKRSILCQGGDEDSSYSQEGTIQSRDGGPLKSINKPGQCLPF